MGLEEMPIQCQDCPLERTVSDNIAGIRKITDETTVADDLGPAFYLDSLEHKHFLDDIAAGYETTHERSRAIWAAAARDVDCIGPVDGQCMLATSREINVSEPGNG